MIVNDKFKFIYIHIPKTGGSSLENRLNNIRGTEYKRPPHGSIKGYDTDGQYIFATIRNPFKWYASFFNFKGSTWSHDLYDPDRTHMFEVWLKGMLNLDIPQKNAIAVGRRNTDYALDYQFHLSLYESGKKIDGAGWMTHLFLFSCCKDYEMLIEKNDIQYIIDNVHEHWSVDTIIDTDNLDNIHEYITHDSLHAAMKHTQPVHLNRGDRADYDELYTDELRSLVRERDKLLFKLGEYETCHTNWS